MPHLYLVQRLGIHEAIHDFSPPCMRSWRGHGQFELLTPYRHVQKDVKDQLGRSCEKLNITSNQGGEYLTYKIGHVLRRKCLLKLFIEGNIEGRI
jgi:hypothetical protein